MASFTSKVQNSIAHTESTITITTDPQYDEALGGRYYCLETKNARQHTGSSQMEPQAALAKWLDSKKKDWGDTEGKRRPLQLLDLPMDVLKDIITEVTHTNDLASLALTCSALHSLAIPLIYSRFDIVWPDAHNSLDSRQGVDALTYGLATLVMGDENHSATLQASGNAVFTCSHCGMLNESIMPPSRPLYSIRRRRRGNYYPHYTKKFSLGNGPDEWIKEYLINRESGKMLGTLVALAIARMPNLETFVWDMPTGILRDCWLALASLSHGPNSKLENVWIRFHDNTEIISTTEVLALTSSPPQSPSDLSLPHANEPQNIMDKPSRLDWSYRQIERPNFSILPPLKSLTALNIDEPAYIDEMSTLLEHSLSSLRTLRIGVASTVVEEGFASLRNVNFDFKSTPLDPLTGKSVLEMLLSKINSGSAANTRNAVLVSKKLNNEAKAANTSDITALSSTMLDSIFHASKEPTGGGGQVSCSDLISSPTLQAGVESDPAYILQDLVTPLGCVASLHQPEPEIGADFLPQSPAISTAAFNEHVSDKSESTLSNIKGQPPSEDIYHNTIQFSVLNASASVDSPALQTPEQRRLRLQELEMEFVHLTPQVLLRTVDWSVVSTLTLLHCQNHDQLWKAFRRAFSPSTATTKPLDSTNTQPKRGSHNHFRHLSSSISIPRSEYRLGLKRLHTNTVSRSLISFLNETLAPNSLEWLFLQDGGASSSDTQSDGSASWDSPVSIDSIFRGPLKRHRASISKLMIDSGYGKTGSRVQSQRWGKWKLNREILSFITSGKMSSLRELAFIVEYKDWHFFLQKIPHIPHLRSLYVPHIVDHVYGHHLDSKELALQILDIVALRPELELCYVGISTKCFEILEGEQDDDSAMAIRESAPIPVVNAANDTAASDEDSDNDGDEDDEATDSGDNDHGAGMSGSLDAGDNTDSEWQDDSQDDSDDASDISEGNSKLRPKFRLREILFYDDKISIFKARRARL